MKILMTGGAGFLGSNLARFFAQKHPDYNISVLDPAPPETAAESIGADIFESPNFSYWQGSVLDKNLAGNLVRNNGTVLHLAAETDVEKSVDSPLSFFETNVNGTLNMISAARSHPPEKFIHFSASNVYGAPYAQPATEDHPLLPREPYGGSKAGGESIINCFTHSYDLPCLIIRPFNIYGPLQNPNNPVPLFITNAIDEQPINLQEDGTSAGDWMFVEDFCGAVDKIIQADFQTLSGELINLGTGTEKTLSEIAGAILSLLDKSESLIRFTEGPDMQPRRMVASVSKAELLTGWSSSAGLEQGLKKTVKWYLENQDWWRKRKKDENTDYRSNWIRRKSFD